MIDNQIVVSAGDAITARLVEQAGFDGIWISGFEASARLGLADNGSITMSEMLNVAKPIVKAVSIPVYVDVDTGYGNLVRTIEEFEDIGVAGLCVEDNKPELKTNSLWGGQIDLMNMHEFARRIDVKRDYIKIIARTEALIRGYGEAEALTRLRLYSSVGADFVLPHARNVKDIVKPSYQNQNYYSPFAIVPTKFPEKKNDELFGMGYSMVIWANQTERVKIKAVREMLDDLKTDDCAEFIERDLSATLEEMKGLMPDG